ncbi:enhancer of mRNA-decapping protein 3 isoform X2 [Ostrinia furnacalis]|uniref:enhancer of mRNA-decapping protein 3 isoform X2 n=1 Tax=Ostrinia furnacalis TaxID=93504 RepID=UPI001038DBD4|nr:enhancer of mRNA-decapping protein 3 isoform X2 [Ostrinia furnacalis]
MAKWIGYAVSVNCGEPLGCYQGTILEADGNTITLTKAFRNGFPYPKAQVTLNAADIRDLKIIETRPEPAEPTHSTVAVTKNNKKGQRATVCENLQANPTNSGHQFCLSVAPSSSRAQAARAGGSAPAPARSKPIEIQGNRNNNKNNTHAGSYGNSGTTPKGRGGGGGAYEKARRRNEACFGEAASPAIDDDFDFEGNLALFDKRALWESMRNSKPDLVRQADEAGKLRHDENVLGGGGGASARRAIRVPDELRGPLDYVTDDAVLVPAVAPALRRRLWDGLERLGLGDSARTLLARGAADVCLRLVGGGRRLDPRNAHQTPAVALLAAPAAPGAAAAARCLRLLHSHGARVALHVAGEGACRELDAELAALALSGVRAGALDALPSPDLVLLALPAAGAAAALAWARAARAATVAVEPPEAGWEAAGVRCRAAVQALLPAALGAGLGRVYLVDVAPPPPLFREQRVAYRPPFGAQPVLALHVADHADAEPAP